jgi:hypothetical protein
MELDATCSGVRSPEALIEIITANVLDGISGDVLPHMLGQYFVDQRLVADTTTARLFAELIENIRIDPNGDQLTRFDAKRRPPNATHAFQLRCRRFRDVREINLSPRTPRARADSRAAC